MAVSLQPRRAGLPAVVRAWATRGVAVAPLSDDQHDALVAWLRSTGRGFPRPVACVREHLHAFAQDHETVIAMNIWAGLEAVGVIAPADVLRGDGDGLRALYPDGYLVADPGLQSALLVDFDAVHGTAICKLARSRAGAFRRAV